MLSSAILAEAELRENSRESGTGGAELTVAAPDDGAVGEDSHNWRGLAGRRGAWTRGFAQLTVAAREDGGVSEGDYSKTDDQSN